MPKKKVCETQQEQVKRFREHVQKMIDDGELNPTEADAAFERSLKGVATLHEQWLAGEEDRETLD